MEHPQQNDEFLWQLARKRTAFKASFTAYLLVNSFLVVLWYLTSGVHSYFWPIWPMLGWGLGVATQYAGAYHATRIFSVEEEYRKLKEEQHHS